MKRIKILIVICSLLCLLSGCKKNNKDNNFVFENNSRFQYNLDNPISFTEKNGCIWAVCKGKTTAECFDSKGKKIKEIELGKGEHTSLCVDNNYLVAFTYLANGSQITQYNLETNEMKTHMLPENITGAISMALTKDDIYLIYWDEDNSQHLDSEDECDYEEHEFDDGYVNMGECAVSINRSSYDVTKLPIENVISLYQISDDEIMYYAHDENKGYYLASFDCNKKVLGEKKYTESLGYIFGFAMDKDKVISEDFGQRRLVLSDVNDPDKKVDILDQVVYMTGNDIKYDNGKCYVLDEMTKDIVRIDCSSALANNKEITFYYTMSMEDPYSCGYSIKSKLLDEDEFALSVMAGDSSYDICMMDSSDPKAGEIRDKGAFYPLNEVPNVKEYLNMCHGYIKEAAINENSEIWMIPIAVDIPFIMYNKATCNSNGVDIEKIKDCGELLETVDALYDKENLREWYSINGFEIQQNLINQYNKEFILNTNVVNYNTDKFKRICELMKKHPADSDESLHTWISEESEHVDDLEGYYNNILFSLEHYYNVIGWDELPYSIFNAKGLPAIKEKQEKNYGKCIYLSVNQNSDNLEGVLNYISAYCKYMMDRNDTFMFKDNTKSPYSNTKLSKDIYSVYKKGDICFEMPNEIFWETYLDYQKEKMNFDELAEELNRKVKMYLNE